MAVAAHMLLLLVSFLLPFSSVSIESPQPALEEGYTISTILDGNKLQEPIHPYALQRREEAGGRSTLLVLDSAASSFFELQLPLSQDGLVRRVAGDGVAGYSDGAGDASRFAHPRSFAVDGKGNVYVADRTSHVIRKIDAQGVTTTVAGGYSRKAGKTDGPSQNASFSDDFDLLYVPDMCVLLISDRGNSLVRQMSLKQEDCIYKSQNGLGGTYLSLIAILCLLIGIVIGLLLRSFIFRETLSHKLGMIWKHFQVHLGVISPTLCSVIKSATAELRKIYFLVYKTMAFVLSYPSTMVSIHEVENTPTREPVSLLDSNMVVKGVIMPSVDYVDQLKDMITFHENSCSADGIVQLVDYVGQLNDMISFDENSCSLASNSPVEDYSKSYPGSSISKIDAMMMEHVSGFDGHAGDQRQSSVSSTTLVKRQRGTSAL